MKKTILLFAAVILLASATLPNRNPRTFTLTEEQAGKLFSAAQVAYKAIPTSSSITAAEASGAIQNLQEVTKVIGEQYQAYLKADSVKQKK